MIDIILISDKEIIKMNKEWFGRSHATDVIAFDDGEVYISVDTAKRQAKERGVSVGDELLRLAIHGLVHIEGYDDLTLEKFCRMRCREWEVLIRSLG